MKLARLVRTKDTGKETLGTLSLYDADGFKELMVCKTVELPWKGNARSVSCIPPGRYICKLRQPYDNFPYKHYDVLDVNGRDGIKIHSANYVRQLRGCITPGAKHVDIDGDGQLDVVNSRMTLAKIVDAMGEKFELIVL